MLLLAAAVESNSEHPLGAAIVAFALAYLQQQRRQQTEQNETSALHRNGSSNGIGSAEGGSLPLPACRDVEVAVGQGISAWVALPAAASPVKNSSSASSVASLQSRDALLRLQLAAASSQAAVPLDPVAAEALLLEAATGADALPAEVQVSVGSRRLVAQQGLALPSGAEGYMKEQEVGAAWTCATHRLLDLSAL